MRTYTLEQAADLRGVELGREALRKRVAGGQIAGHQDDSGKWLIDADRFDLQIAAGEVRRARKPPQGTSSRQRISDEEGKVDLGSLATRWALAEARVQVLEAEVRRLQRTVRGLTSIIEAGTWQDDLDSPE